ncbi:MAG: translocation/assembly module TamB domain-containing protein [Candidatus Acidiferrales bacterium]
MSGRWKRWTRRLLFLAIVVVVSIVAAFETGFVERWVRHVVVQQIEQGTGARVELGGFHFHAWRLHAEMNDLTLHGLEDAGKPPLFHATHVNVRIRIISFFGREIALDELTLERPAVALRFEKDGRSNLPVPKVHARMRPWRDALFSLQIGRLELRDGTAAVNDQRMTLAVQGRNLQFTLHYDASTSGNESYVGKFQWQQVELAARRDAPFKSDISAKFTLHRDSFELDELIWKLPHSELNLRAELPSFSKSDVNLRYRGRLSLADLRTIFREPLVPDGITDFSGDAQYVSGEWTAAGHYAGHEIHLPYQWFHASGLDSWGDYELAHQLLVVPELSVRALGGAVAGRLEMDLPKLVFRTETHLRGASLAAAFAAVDNENFPVKTLHWDARMEVDSANTWVANFKHFRSKGESRWSPPGTLPPGMIPVTARIEYDTSEDSALLALEPSEISTPNSKLEMEGTLGAKDSAMELKIRADDLVEWDDFINVLRGVDEVPTRVAGRVNFRGRVVGPLVGPSFRGHMHATEACYDTLYWDEMEGDLDYSPDAFQFTKVIARHGGATGMLDVNLKLDGDWNFLPQSPWTLDARLEHAPTEDLQAMFQTNYPVKGFLGGAFHGSGTHAAPVFDANFIIDDIETKGMRFDRLSGQLRLAHDEYRLSRAELRGDTGRASGDILFRPVEQDTEFHVTGTGIALEKFAALQNPALPISGRLDFDLRGSGPILAPTLQGELRVAKLQAGSDVQGDFRGQFTSNGQSLRVALTSEMTQGKLEGQLTIGLTGDDPISGQLTVAQFDMDPLISAGLHLKQLTGHSSVDGVFTFSGALRQPDTIGIDADIARISFDYDFVQLQNDGPVRIVYHRNEVRIEKAHLHGPNTDVQLSGSARFDRDRQVRLNLSGGLNLRFLRSWIPDFESQGAADVNVSMEGTMARPRITGRASVHDASANYADFPVGLSHVNGDIVFDRSRLLFDHVTAQSGGGQLSLSGSVTYGEGDLRYEINAETTVVRVRYPAGMSWLLGGTLQLAGTNKAAILSGRVEVKRLLFAEGVDVASFFATASETTTAPATTSPFLRNLSFDVQGNTGPGARIEWSGAQLDIDGDIRLRGTWDRPVLLGHIHLLGGQMAFRGNTFQLTRGDLNFANPFRLDPVLNVEATATISQYQVTINFSGPASRLSLNYRSDPPLPDTDIIALLALGSPGEGSALRSQSSAGSQNYGATALLSEAISSGLGGRIERLFGISHFRVDPFLSGTATESNAAARVTIEQQVTHDLTITYSTNAATSNQYQLIQVEYTVKRGLSVVFLRDINGTYGLDIKFVKHFK